MNLPEKNSSAADRWRLAEDLVEAALVDTVYRDLYLQRARDFLEPVLSEARFVEFKQQETDASNLPNRIFVAMSRENWSEMAAQLENEEQGEVQRAPGPTSLVAGKTAELTVQFPQEVLQRARSFGLAPMRMEDGGRHLNLSPEGLASLYRYLWHPAFTDEISREGVDLHKKVVPFPADVPAAPRDLMEQFALHPFVNSGGARYAPTLADEDVLVEDFEETDAGRGYPASALLSALGF